MLSMMKIVVHSNPFLTLSLRVWVVQRIINLLDITEEVIGKVRIFFVQCCSSSTYHIRTYRRKWYCDCRSGSSKWYRVS